MFVSVIIPPPADPHASSCPTVLTTTVRPVPLTCIATGGVWAQGQALPSPSSLLPPHPTPPPPAPPVHGPVLPQPCCQTNLSTARWAPPWCLHHESPAGRFVHHLGLDDQHIPILLCSSLVHFVVVHQFASFILWLNVQLKIWGKDI